MAGSTGFEPATSGLIVLFPENHKRLKMLNLQAQTDPLIVSWSALE